MSSVSSDRHVSRCSKDFVTLKYTVPKRITSGSEVLWAPVALSTVRFESICTSIYYEDDTVVALHSNYGVDSEAGQFASRWPQPFMHQVPNHGQYHLDWTGDVTAFSEDGDYTFQLFGTEAHDPVGDDEYAVIVQFKFLKPCKLLFYVDGRKVDGGVRRTDMDLTRDVGFSYHHATSAAASGHSLPGNPDLLVVELANPMEDSFGERIAMLKFSYFMLNFNLSCASVGRRSRRWSSRARRRSVSSRCRSCKHSRPSRRSGCIPRPELRRSRSASPSTSTSSSPTISLIPRPSTTNSPIPFLRIMTLIMTQMAATL